jgi:hypothetical protein
MVLDKGENMFPYLFALFLNDLENFMKNQNSTGLNTIDNLKHFSIDIVQ